MKRLAWILLGLALLTPACATTGQPVNLDQTSWVVTAIKGTPTLADHQPTMTFADNKVSGTASCNRYGGGYTQNGSAVTFSQLAVTAMMCTPDAVMTQESAFTAALSSASTLTGTADAPVLVDPSGQPLLALAKAAATSSPSASSAALIGTDWQLSTIHSGSTASSPVADSTVSLTIADGSLSGKACNTFRASLTTDGSSTFTVGPVISTKMACPSEALSKQEHTVLTLLGKVTTMSLSGSQLSLSTADGDGLDFTAK